MFQFVELVSVFILYGVAFSEAVSYESDVILNGNQAKALIEFKARVVPKLIRDFEKEDLFLVQFLRARNFDVDRAEEFILRESKWRTEEGMDTIHEEDWSDMECCYNVELNGEDRDGRPLLFYDFGDWDLRQAILAGKRDRLVKWMYKGVDLARNKTRQLGLQGKNVTRCNILFDLKGFNAVEHINALTVPFFVTIASGFESHFPSMTDTIFTINTPAVFEFALQVMKPVLSPATRDSLQTYGNQESVWVPKIRERIDPSQLSKRYGGDKDTY